MGEEGERAVGAIGEIPCSAMKKDVMAGAKFEWFYCEGNFIGIYFSLSSAIFNFIFLGLGFAEISEK